MVLKMAVFSADSQNALELFVNNWLQDHDGRVEIANTHFSTNTVSRPVYDDGSDDMETVTEYHAAIYYHIEK